MLLAQSPWKLKPVVYTAQSAVLVVGINPTLFVLEMYEYPP